MTCRANRVLQFPEILKQFCRAAGIQFFSLVGQSVGASYALRCAQVGDIATNSIPVPYLHTYDISPTDHLQVIDSHSSCFRSFRVDDLYDLYDLAHVTGGEPYSLHDLAHVSWVGSVICRSSCTTSHKGR